MIALVPSVNEYEVSKGLTIHAVQKVRVRYSSGDEISPSGPVFVLQAWCSFSHEDPEVSYSDAQIIDCEACLRVLK